MSRQARDWLRTLSLLSAALILAGLVVVFAVRTAFAGASPSGSVATSLLGFAVIWLLGGGCGFGLVAWVFGVIYAARARQWVWAVFVLLTGLVGAFVYSLAGAKTDEDGPGQ